MALIAVMLISAFPNMTSNARAFDVELHVFSDGLFEEQIVFPCMNSTVISNIALLHNATALAATMDVNAREGANNRCYAENVTLDVGDDGTYEWGFTGNGYGGLGNQTRFFDGSTELCSRFTSPAGGRASILLPKEASPYSLDMMLRGYSMPNWSVPAHAMPNDTIGEAWYPQIIGYDEKSYVVWSTNDTAVTGDPHGDYDIVVKEVNTTTGLGNIVTLSPQNDIENDSPPWDGTGPQVAIFDGKLIVVWEQINSTLIYKSDLLMRAFDGSAWGAIRQVNPYGESIKNTMHQLCVFDGRLYVFWHRPYVTQYGYTGFRTVYSWTDDMNSWHEPLPVVPESNLTHDWTSSSVVYDGKMWVFWDAIAPNYTDGGGYNICTRYFDGETWSNITQISPWSTGDNYELVQVDTYQNPVSGKWELWAAWGTARGPADRRGDEVYARGYDGENWGQIFEISGENETRFDLYPQLASCGNYLYFVWVSGPQALSDDIPLNQSINSTVYTTWGDIMFRFYDGYFWSEAMELTDRSVLDSASDPELRVVNGDVYVIWDYNWTNANGTKDGDIIIRKLSTPPSSATVSIGVIEAAHNAELTSIGRRVHLSSSEVSDLLSSAPAEHTFVDCYGNEMCEIEITLNVSCSSNTTLELSELAVPYDLTYRIRDFSGALNAYLANYTRAHAFEEENGSSPTVNVPVNISSSTPGVLWLSNLSIAAMIDERPVVKEIPRQYIDEDSTVVRALDLSEYFSDDLDDDSLVYSIIYQENVSLVECTLTGSWLGFSTKMANWYGNSSFKIMASDRLSQHALATINLTVRPVNDAPVYLGGLNTTRLPENGTWSVNLDEYFYDVEGDIGFYISSNSSLAIEPLTWVATWHAEPNVCLRDVVITAFDAEDRNLTASSNKFSLGSQPVLPDYEMDEDTDLVNAEFLDDYFKDAIAVGNLTYSVVNVETQNNVSATINSGWLSFYTMKMNWSGVVNFSIIATDELGVVSACPAFSVIVRPVNDAPVYLGGLGNVHLKPMEKWQIDLTMYFYDSDGPKIGFSSNARGAPIAFDNATCKAIYIAKGKGIRNAEIICTDGLGETARSGLFSIYVSGTTEGGESPCINWLLIIIAIVVLAAFLLRRKLREKWDKWEL